MCIVLYKFVHTLSCDVEQSQFHSKLQFHHNTQLSNGLAYLLCVTYKTTTLKNKFWIQNSECIFSLIFNAIHLAKLHAITRYISPRFNLMAVLLPVALDFGTTSTKTSDKVQHY